MTPEELRDHIWHEASRRWSGGASPIPDAVLMDAAVAVAGVEIQRLQEKADGAYSEGYGDGYGDCRRNLTDRVVESLGELIAELEADARPAAGVQHAPQPAGEEQDDRQ